MDEDKQAKIKELEGKLKELITKQQQKYVMLDLLAKDEKAANIMKEVLEGGIEDKLKYAKEKCSADEFSELLKENPCISHYFDECAKAAQASEGLSMDPSKTACYTKAIDIFWGSVFDLLEDRSESIKQELAYHQEIIQIEASLHKKDQ